MLKQTISLQIFKGYFPQFLQGPFLNTLSHLLRDGTVEGKKLLKRYMTKPY